MKPTIKPVLISLSALTLAAALASGCAKTTEQKVEQKTDAAIADTANAMNTVATSVKDVSTNVAAHVADFATNAWAKTKEGAQKVADVTTNVFNDVKQSVK